MSEPDQPTRRPGRPREIYRRAPGVGAPIGTRSDEVQATTRAILEAGQRLVVERGARAVTIAAVAAEAHVDVSTVTYHFGSRAGLFEAIRDHQYRDDLAEVVAEALRRDDPPARLDAYFAGVRRMLDDSMATRAYFEISVAALSEPFVRERLGRQDEWLIDEFTALIGGEQSPGGRAVAQFIFAAVDGVELHRALYGAAYPVDEVIRLISEVAHDAIRTLGTADDDT